MEKIILKPIGVIHSPYKKMKDIPCQGYKSNKTGEILVYKEYAEGLKDIDGFSHIIILYYFHKAKEYLIPIHRDQIQRAKRASYLLHAKPFLDDKPKGIFAIRGPHRPNHIGLSVVKLIKRKGNVLKVGDMDVLDGTPLLDIKPYVSKFDVRENIKNGWLEGKL